MDISGRLKELTSLHGGVLIALGLVVLLLRLQLGLQLRMAFGLY